MSLCLPADGFYLPNLHLSANQVSFKHTSNDVFFTTRVYFNPYKESYLDTNISHVRFNFQIYERVSFKAIKAETVSYIRC